MKIDLAVTFRSERVKDASGDWEEYCFRHAVIRALQGDVITARADDAQVFCGDCANEQERV